MRRLGRLATRRRWWVITLAMLFVPTAALGGSTEDRLSAGVLDEPGRRQAARRRCSPATSTRGHRTCSSWSAPGAASWTGPRRPRPAWRWPAAWPRNPGSPRRCRTGARPRRPLRSRDGSRALVLDRLAGNDARVRRATAVLTPRYQSRGPEIDVAAGGSSEVARQIAVQAKHDLGRSEAISLPVTLIRLLLVFGGAWQARRARSSSTSGSPTPTPQGGGADQRPIRTCRSTPSERRSSSA
jgi:RND superfamily putative drug exporter